MTAGSRIHCLSGQYQGQRRDFPNRERHGAKSGLMILVLPELVGQEEIGRLQPMPGQYLEYVVGRNSCHWRDGEGYNMYLGVWIGDEIQQIAQRRLAGYHGMLVP